MNTVALSAHHPYKLLGAGLAMFVSTNSTIGAAEENKDLITLPHIHPLPREVAKLLLDELRSVFVFSGPDSTSSATVRSEPTRTTPQNISIPSEPPVRGKLYDAIQNLRSSLTQWEEDDGIAPSSRVLVNAEKTLAMLPETFTDPRLGLGGSGDLYFSWENEKGIAFLTIESNELHLLLKPTTATPVYLDQMPNDTKILENKILPRLERFAT